MPIWVLENNKWKLLELIKKLILNKLPNYQVNLKKLQLFLGMDLPLPKDSTLQEKLPNY